MRLVRREHMLSSLLFMLSNKAINYNFSLNSFPSLSITDQDFQFSHQILKSCVAFKKFWSLCKAHVYYLYPISVPQNPWYCAGIYRATNFKKGVKWKDYGLHAYFRACMRWQCLIRDHSLLDCQVNKCIRSTLLLFFKTEWEFGWHVKGTRSL